MQRKIKTQIRKIDFNPELKLTSVDIFTNSQCSGKDVKLSFDQYQTYWNHEVPLNSLINDVKRIPEAVQRNQAL